MTDLAESALEATRYALGRVEKLMSAGWTVTYQETVGLAEGEGTLKELIDAINTLTPLAAGHSEVIGTFASASLTLRVLPGGKVEVVGGQGDISEAFGVDDRSDASLAWAGDVEAAYRLPGDWKARVQLIWTASLKAAVPDTEWLYFRTTAALVRYIQAKPFWLLQPEFDTARGTVAVVRDLPAGASLSSPCLNVVPLASKDLPTPEGIVLSSRRHDPVLAKAISPEALLPTAVNGEDALPVAEALWSVVTATSWARLATDLTPNPESGALDVEFFGLQRVRHTLPRNGPPSTATTAKDSVDLVKWVEQEGSIDRMLAVRQVVSLRIDQPPWERAGDIRLAAAPIFKALRSDAVAEALKAVRETRATALETARRTVELSAVLAKSAVERMLASVVAAGGIFIANTTNKITAEQASDLRLVVAGALLGLGIWNVVVERPTLFRSINDFKADLPSMSELLAEEDRVRIVDLASLSNASKYARMMACIIPLMYVVLAVAALTVNR